MLTISCKIGDVVEIGDTAAVRVEAKSGQLVRLAFAAPRSVEIKLNPFGVIPKKFVTGTINQTRQRVMNDIRENRPIAAAY